jgi:hypothetical protein
MNVLLALSCGDLKSLTKDSYSRSETRIREENVWLVEKAILPKKEQWVYTVLPPGRRVMLVFPPPDIRDISSGHGWVEALDRETLSPIRYPDFQLACCSSSKEKEKEKGEGGDCALDCLVTRDGAIYVFDAIRVHGNSVCGLPLLGRMAAIPNNNGLLKKLEYKQISGSSLAKVVASITRKDGRRLLLVDSTAPYKPNSRSAATWRPPYPAEVAILCVCNSHAMASISRDEAWMAPVGRIAPTSTYSHMGVYACVYDRARKHWTVLERAKRKEALGTYQQAMEIVQSRRKVLDGPDIFNVLSSL